MTILFVYKGDTIADLFHKQGSACISLIRTEQSRSSVCLSICLSVYVCLAVYLSI
jgi:hypothetical protein